MEAYRTFFLFFFFFFFFFFCFFAFCTCAYVSVRRSKEVYLLVNLVISQQPQQFSNTQTFPYCTITYEYIICLSFSMLVNSNSMMAQPRAVALLSLQQAVSRQNQECVAVALNNIDLDFERTNLFAANCDLFERAVLRYHKGVFALLVDHFKKHFLYRQSLEIPQHSADCNAEAEEGEEEEENFDDYSKYILPTPFSEMKENFETITQMDLIDLSAVDEATMAELKRMFAE